MNKHFFLFKPHSIKVDLKVLFRLAWSHQIFTKSEIDSWLHWNADISAINQMMTQKGKSWNTFGNEWIVEKCVTVAHDHVFPFIQKWKYDSHVCEVLPWMMMYSIEVFWCQLVHVLFYRCLRNKGHNLLIFPCFLEKESQNFGYLKEM